MRSGIDETRLPANTFLSSGDVGLISISEYEARNFI